MQPGHGRPWPVLEGVVSMQITCGSCGKTFEAARKSRQFCSDACRKRAKRGNVIAIESARVPTMSAGSVEASTQAELEAVDLLGSALGQMAVALARRIDVGNETGAATAALARELRATMEAVEARAPQPEGKVSSLRLRLAERVQGA